MYKKTNIWFGFILILIFTNCGFYTYAQELEVYYSLDKNLNIKSFDVSNDGQKTVMAIYPYSEAIIYNSITGNELARLTGEKSTPKKVYIDDRTKNIIVEYIDSIYMWNLVDFSHKATYDIPNFRFSDFCEASGQTVYLTYNEIIVLDLETGTQTPIKINVETNYNDNIKFSPNGQFIYLLSDGKLIAYETKNYSNQKIIK